MSEKCNLHKVSFGKFVTGTTICQYSSVFLPSFFSFFFFCANNIVLTIFFLHLTFPLVTLAPFKFIYHHKNFYELNNLSLVGARSIQFSPYCVINNGMHSEFFSTSKTCAMSQFLLEPIVFTSN